MRASWSVRVAAAALASVAMAVTQVLADDVTVKVMSFNIRTSQASEDAAQRCSNWAGDRKGNVVSEFKSADADFVGTQETSDEQKTFLDDALKATYQSIGTPTGSLNGMASEVDALYYKFSDWKLLAQGTFWFGPNPDAPSSGWDMKYYRTFVYGRFEHIESGDTVCVLNTHYETPGNDEAQNEASKIIIAKTPSLCAGTDKLTVLTGDFNALRNYKAIQTLFADNWVDNSEDPTFCGDMLSPTCQTKFDFTLYKLGSGTCQKKTEVLRQEFDGCYPSDHAALMSTFCLSGSCCGADTLSNSTNQSSLGSSTTGSRASTTGSGENESDVKPGVVVSQGSETVLTSGAVDTSGVTKSGEDSATSTGGTDAVHQITTKSESSTNATGTVFAVMGVLAAVGVVCAFVIKKKRTLEAQLDDQKSSGLAPIPSYFSSEEQDALSPRRSMPARESSKTQVALARKFSSPVPTLETITEDDRKRSFSQTSSIPCSRRSSLPLSPESYNDSMDRTSSPVLMDDDGRSTDRGSSRLYFSEVVSERNLNNKPRDGFAML